MLVLTRKLQEKIIMDVPNLGPIEVVVTKIHGGRVSLGITAPKEVIVRRSELPADLKAATEAQPAQPAVV